MDKRITLVIGCLIGIFLPLFVSAKTLAPNLKSFLQPIYTKDSLYFDANNHRYADPTYGQPEWTTLPPSRDGVFAATTYQFRANSSDAAAKKYMKSMIQQSITRLCKPVVYDNFQDSQTMVALVFLETSTPSLWTPELHQQLWNCITKNALTITETRDTENRLFTTIARWSYLLPQLEQRGLISHDTETSISVVLAQRMDSEIKKTISPSGWYREGTSFTVHYDIVSAYNLLLYARWSKQPKYEVLAKKMYTNIKHMAFPNGMIESLIGHRPIGSGPQTYLMLGVMGRAWNDPDADVFFTYLSGSTFFSDPRFPNRLEYHYTINDIPGLKPLFHDDIAFSDVGETARHLPGLAINQPIVQQKKLQPMGNLSDRDFTIVRSSSKVTITDHVLKTVTTVKQRLDGIHTALTKKALPKNKK